MADSSQDWATEMSVGHPVLDQLIRSNAMRMQQLGQTYNVGIDVTRAMVQHLLETIYPEMADRQEYELAFQNYLSALLTLVEERAKAAAQPDIAVPPQGLIVPGQ